MSDNDGDGIPDYYERNGMRIQTGELIYTDPNNPDSDGDGLLDGEEIKHISSPNNIYCFIMKSDPNKKDSDGDGLNDDTELTKTKSKPMYANTEIKPFDSNSFYFQHIGQAWDNVNKIVRSVWIVNGEYENKAINIYKENVDFKNDLLIIDKTDENEINYQIYDSYKYNDYTLMTNTLEALQKYNKKMGRTQWKRTIDGLRHEWAEHNLLYLIPFESIKEPAQHADLDQFAKGTPLGLDGFSFYITEDNK